MNFCILVHTIYRLIIFLIYYLFSFSLTAPCCLLFSFLSSTYFSSPISYSTLLHLSIYHTQLCALLLLSTFQPHPFLSHIISYLLLSSPPFPSLCHSPLVPLSFLSASSYHNFLAHHLILSLSLILSILSYPIQSYPTASSLSFFLFSVLSSSYFFFNLLASYHPPSSFPPPLLSLPLLFLTLLISSCSMSSHLI